MKKYFYPEFLKLAAHVASEARNFYNKATYPNITDVYVEYEGDLRPYNPSSKKGSMFFLIDTPGNNRQVASLTYEIIDDVIHYGLGYHHKFQKPLTPGLIKELKAVEMTTQYFWNLGDKHYKNVAYMTIGELKEALCNILDAGTDCKIEVNSEDMNVVNPEFRKMGQLISKI
jgi:hypothetical protein